MRNNKGLSIQMQLHPIHWEDPLRQRQPPLVPLVVVLRKHRDDVALLKRQISLLYALASALLSPNESGTTHLDALEIVQRDRKTNPLDRKSVV